MVVDVLFVEGVAMFTGVVDEIGEGVLETVEVEGDSDEIGKVENEGDDDKEFFFGHSIDVAPAVVVGRASLVVAGLVMVANEEGALEDGVD